MPSSDPPPSTSSTHPTVNLKPSTTLRLDYWPPLLFPPLPTEALRRPAGPPTPGSSQYPSGFQPLGSPPALPAPSDRPQPPSGPPSPDRPQPPSGPPSPDWPQPPAGPPLPDLPKPPGGILSNGSPQYPEPSNPPPQPPIYIPHSQIEQMFGKGISNFYVTMPVTTQRLPTGEAIKSFLMTSTGWNCIPSIAPSEGMNIFYLFP